MSAADHGRTDIVVGQLDGRSRLRTRSGLLRAHQVRAPDGWTKIGLIASTALLLGGDRVELRVEVGPGARLWLFDVAGTVAYDGRGRDSGWQVEATVADGAELIMAGEPFVVSAGADVDRSLDLEVADGGCASIRETVVLGRVGEVGGRLRNRTSVHRDGVPVALEDQRLETGLRRLPGILGAERVLDTITSVGVAPELVDLASNDTSTTFMLPDAAGVVTRWIGRELADSPIHRRWLSAVAARRNGQLPTR